jgi:hypothetical protein
MQHSHSAVNPFQLLREVPPSDQRSPEINTDYPALWQRFFKPQGLCWTFLNGCVFICPYNSQIEESIAINLLTER